MMEHHPEEPVGQVQPQHRSGLGRGVGMKATDAATMPLCRTCHRQVHDDPRMKLEQWRWLALTLILYVEQQG